MPSDLARKNPFLKMGSLPHVLSSAPSYDDLTTNFEVRHHENSDDHVTALGRLTSQGIETAEELVHVTVSPCRDSG